MALRVSGEMTDSAVDVSAITDGKAASSSGVAHAEALVEFAEAVVGRDDAALERARQRILDELGNDELVDAAAVAANFERMDRIADSTGIPLEGPMKAMSFDLREKLGTDRFGSSANTAGLGAMGRLFGRVLQSLTIRLVKVVGARRRRRATARS